MPDVALDLGGRAPEGPPAPVFDLKGVVPTITTARYRFDLDRSLSPEEAQKIRDIPGAFVWPREAPDRASAPITIGWAVERDLVAMGIRFALRAPRLPRSVIPLPDAEDRARARLAPSEWKADRWDWLMPYQREAIGFAAWIEGGHVHHSPGAGKTAAAAAWALAAPGPICVVTPAAVRDKWWREIQMLADIEPHAIDPTRYARACAERLGAYLERCAATGIRPFVIVAWEGLSAWIGELAQIRWASAIADESQEMKQPKRRKYLIGETTKPDGTPGMKAIDLENTSSAGEKLAAVSLRRLATTATPMPDRMRDWWSQCDFVEPGCHGNFNTWARRYCAATPGTWGGLDTRGVSNTDEFNARMSFVIHRVPYAVTHRDLPPKRRIVTYLPSERQCRPIGGYAARIREALRQGDDQLMTMRLMEAASRKRDYVIATVEQYLLAGQKCVIGTGLRDDCDRWVEDLAPLIARVARRRGEPVWFAKAHGGTPNRDDLRAAYMGEGSNPAVPGPALFVCTVDAFAVGVDFHDTDYVATAMLVWNPGKAWQWENRFNRRGQRRSVLFEWIVAEGTVDEHVAALNVPKLEALDRVAPDEALSGMAQGLRGLDDPAAVMAALIARMAASAAEE